MSAAKERARAVLIAFGVSSLAGFVVGAVMAVAFLAARPAEGDCSDRAVEDVLIEFGTVAAERFERDCRFDEITRR